MARKFRTTDEKMALVQLIREEKGRGRKVADICADLGLNPSMFYTWQKGVRLAGPGNIRRRRRTRRGPYKTRLTETTATLPATTLTSLVTATKGKAMVIVGSAVDLADILRRIG
jgi:transposase-like protein